MWNIYIVKCNDGSLYTGITVDIQKRVLLHNKGKASKYTRSRRPVVLAYSENAPSRSRALKREIEIKSFPVKNKMKLIQSVAKANFR